MHIIHVFAHGRLLVNVGKSDMTTNDDNDDDVVDNKKEGEKGECLPGGFLHKG